MLRRGFLRSAATVAAIPAVGLPEQAKDWRCIIGGNRSGKSTKCAELVRDFERIEIVGFDSLHSGNLARSYFPDRKLGSVRISGLFHAEFVDQRYLQYWIDKYVNAVRTLNEGHSWALWIDENCLPYIHHVAHLYDRVVMCHWPHPKVKDNEFFKICEKMGNVEHLQMLPHIRYVDGSNYCSMLDPQEFAVRVEGKFPS